MAAHPELAFEQDVLDRAYAHAAASPGEPLIFGRIDHAGERRYIGPHDVVDDGQVPVVIAWHSRPAAPFYTAEPTTVTLKRQFVEHARQLTALYDEIVDGDDRTGAAARAQMERFRGDTKRAATATLTAQQYEAITTDPGTPVVISGGPGTGKTQAGIHRAAWLARHPEVRAAGIAFVAPSARLRAHVAAVLSELDADDVIVTGSVDSTHAHVVVDEAHDLTRDDLEALTGSSASVTFLGDLPPAALPPAALPPTALPSAALPAAHHVALTTSFRVPSPVADLLGRSHVGSPMTSLRDGIGRPLIRPTDASELAADAVQAATAAASTGFDVAVIVPTARLEATRGLAEHCGTRVTVATPAQLSGLEFDAVAVVAPDEIVDESGRSALDLALSRCTQSLAIFHDGPLPTGLEHLRPPSPGRLPHL